MVPSVDAPETPASNTNQDLETLLALPESRSLAVGIASRLRAAILAGHFGPGERLREEVLARSMGVSRGPVREALAGSNAKDWWSSATTGARSSGAFP
jgi:hypothetical protein